MIPLKKWFIAPNTSCARISGGKGGRYRVMDVAGKEVGSYPGHLIGKGLPAGSYFLEYPGKSGVIIKIVKLR